MTRGSEGLWQFWVDRGGTFTDVVSCCPGGSRACHKLLSENPEQYGDAALQGIRKLLGLQAGDPIPSERIAAVKLGTAVATNALLEHKGEPALLLIIRGFRDALRKAYRNRAFYKRPSEKRSPELYTTSSSPPSAQGSAVPSSTN